ncbi:penicillin-binding protein 2 [Paenibacillus sp. N1-5-1-14]|uniref:peptidoglycan D,D-transpeptidase FtsI family protein n=1 Tax=Paenibacillus radicibacter TaxID=2972488 RepID=UPI0021598326|nr:penicillin-binding protein 2 [Paenibacillus radicibacter]MCR8645300.1 penicillin-binding protein 2 [Paenibacillus radicibacter]
MRKKTLHTDNDPQKKELTKKRHFSFRINLFFFLTFVLFSILIVKLAILQFVQGKQLTAEAQRINNRDTQISPIRGNIYDKDGYPIAYSISVQSLFFRLETGLPQKPKPEYVELAYKLEEVFQKYGKEGSKKPTADEIIKDMDVGYDINMKETKPPGLYYIARRIKEDLSKEEIAYILEHRDEFKLLEVNEESSRRYDTNSIAAHLVGYMRPYKATRTSKLPQYQETEGNKKKYQEEEYVGYDGLEYMYQDELRGESGTKSYPVNLKDTIVGAPTIKKPEKGHNLHLTIQKDVQLATEQAITDQIKTMQTSSGNKYASAPNARTGYAVGIEVETGKVISMASMPDYDTNKWVGGLNTAEYNEIGPIVNNGTIRYSFPQLPEEQRKNRLNSIVYMGSVIKPLTILVGLNEKLFTTTQTYNDTGRFTWGLKGKEASLSNSDGVAHGPINATAAIQYSSNTFMSEMIGNKLYSKYTTNETPNKGLDIWDNYLKQFGLGTLTGSGLPYESEGSSEYYNDKNGEPIQSRLIRASWGQNEKYTTLQLAQFAATLASKGKRMKPQFVDKITTVDGDLVKGFTPEMLNEAKFPNEYWKVIVDGMKLVRVQGFEGFPYSMASKTGTSTQTLRGKDVDNAVFIAFAPAENPKFAVAVVVPEGGYGAWNAAPIARKMFDAYDQQIGLTGTPKPPATPTPPANTTP